MTMRHMITMWLGIYTCLFDDELKAITNNLVNKINNNYKFTDIPCANKNLRVRNWNFIMKL